VLHYHHAGTHFLSGRDCAWEESFVPATTTLTLLSGGAIDPNTISGCDISSNAHTNSDTNAEYTDLPLRIHPYQFDIGGINPNIGPYTRTSGQTFVYIDTPDTMDVNDTDMSYNMNGTFFAAGYDSGRLSNFVKDCYANDVNMDMNFTYNHADPTTTPYLSHNLKDHNTTDESEVYRPATGSNHFDTNTTDNNSLITITQGKEFFATDMNGSITMDLGYNFNRDFNQTLNPRYIEFHDFNISYVTNPTGINADLQTNHIIFGNRALDQNVTFVYGRAKPSQPFYDDVMANNIDTPISIVVYCDLGMITCRTRNIDTSGGQTNEWDWYRSVDHIAAEGDGNVILHAGVEGNVSNPDNTTVDPADVDIATNGINNNINVAADLPTRPLTVNISFVENSATDTNTSRWVIYNSGTNSTPVPFYRVRFIGQGEWAGYGDTGHVVDSNISDQKNNRVAW